MNPWRYSILFIVIIIGVISYYNTAKKDKELIKKQIEYIEKIYDKEKDELVVIPNPQNKNEEMINKFITKHNQAAKQYIEKINLGAKEITSSFEIINYEDKESIQQATDIVLNYRNLTDAYAFELHKIEKECFGNAKPMPYRKAEQKYISDMLAFLGCIMTYNNLLLSSKESYIEEELIILNEISFLAEQVIKSEDKFIEDLKLYRENRLKKLNNPNEFFETQK